jgi:7-cyano-7-deazaguanine synthase in queuosine biosynthesis
MIYVEQRPRHEDGQLVMGGRVSVDDASTSFGFRVRGLEQPPPTADWLVPAMLLPAARLGRDLHVLGTCSTQLLHHARTIVGAYATWHDDFKTVQVQAANHSTSCSAGRGVACFISGGVDSFYTLFRNLDAITHVIYICGYDLEAGDARTAEHVTRLQNVASHRGKRFICVTSDLWRFTRLHPAYQRVASGENFPLAGAARWWLYHGAVMASAAMSLNAEIGRCFIASTLAHDFWHPWGSDAILDALWSTESLSFEESGAELDRSEKVAYLAAHPQAHLVWPAMRVCFHNRHGRINCGHCEKCLRTRVALDLAGVAQRPPGLEKPAQAVDLVRLTPTGNSYESWLRLYQLNRARHVPRRLRVAMAIALMRAHEKEYRTRLRTLLAWLLETLRW